MYCINVIDYKKDYSNPSNSFLGWIFIVVPLTAHSVSMLGNRPASAMVEHKEKTLKSFFIHGTHRLYFKIYV